MPADRTADVTAAAALRNAFDRSFAEAPAEAAAVDDLLEIRVGNIPYALRMSEIAGLFADRHITPLPSTVSELLGLTGFRGSILPVYDLAAILHGRADEPQDAAGDTARWMAVAATVPVALAFTAFDEYRRVRRDEIVPLGGEHATDKHAREVVGIENRTRPIISVGSVLDTVANRVRAGAPEKE